MKNEGISFRWGIPELDHGNVIIPEPIYRFHGTLGLKGNAFVLIIQLSAFKYESARGKASPSLQTLADRMGTDRRTVINLVKKLEDQGWLVVKRNPGKNSEYNFESFAKACWELHREAASEETDTTPASEETNTTTGERIATGGVKESTPEEQEVQEQEVEEQESPSPRMNGDDLKRLTEHYATIREARPRGKAWLPIQQGFRQMVAVEEYSVDDVIGCMDRIIELGWTWTIGTVRKWIADFAAGKMPSKNGDSNATPGIKRGSDYYERARKKEDENLAQAHDPAGYDKGTAREA